jgi:hypothetical protein
MPTRAPAKASVTTRNDEDLHLIYEIEGLPSEVDIFELSRVLESLGEVLREGNRVLHPDTDLVLKVQPFEPGSFIMDVAMQVQHQAQEQAPLLAALMTQADLLKQAKDVLEYIGLIKKVGEFGASLLELLRKLRSGRPKEVEEKGDTFRYHAEDGGEITVSAPVHNLYNNGVVNNYIFNIAAPAERPEVESISTYLKGQEEATGVKITKQDVPAIKAYAEPELMDEKVEVIENTPVYVLHPKSGNYGESTGQWTFTIAGTRRWLKAKITDAKFLAKYTNGTIRFYSQDRLKARVHEKQTIEGSKVKVENDIIEVIDYRPAHPSERS